MQFKNNQTSQPSEFTPPSLTMHNWSLVQMLILSYYVEDEWQFFIEPVKSVRVMKWLLHIYIRGVIQGFY